MTKTLTMVKKRLANGDPCPKCVQAQELLDRRGLSARIDRVVWAHEGDPSSEGMRLGAEHRVDSAPFFLATDASGTRVYTSVVAFMKAELDPDVAPAPVAASLTEADLAEEARSLEALSPTEVVARALARHGAGCRIAFSGAEDVAVVDMAARSGHPFTVFCLDTGRLHPETYRFIDKVRARYRIEIDIVSPAFAPLEALVRAKGLFSFYEDGHGECCGVRKVEALRRVLSGADAWMTGQRRDQSPTRTDVPVLQVDRGFTGRSPTLLKYNPVARWSLAETWGYLRENDVPTNELHERGFISIGCEPCTRAVRPGEHERAGRWWWEEATKRECGLHVAK
jgi:phosphoadenosine phosphosulfate reductase